MGLSSLCFADDSSATIVIVVCDQLIIVQDVWHFCRLAGFRREGLSQAILYPLLTTALLFLGPLVQRLTSKDSQSRYPEPLLSSPAAWRDLVVAPLTEEFVFRCLVIAILLHMVRSSLPKLAEGKGLRQRSNHMQHHAVEYKRF